LYQFGRFFCNMRYQFDWANFRRSLLAVLAGNLLYYVSYRYLPLAARHHLYQIDLGLAVDFCMCVVCYGIVRMIW